MSNLSRVVVLVGAGALGKRYLQGLIKSKKNFKLFVFDISTQSLTNAKNLIIENLNNIQIKFISKISEIPKFIDLIIISTTADVRVSLVSKFFNKKNFIIKAWVLEKLLCQSLNDLKSLENFFSENKKAWVNMPRRMMPWHQKIYSYLPKNQLLNVEVIGSNWGLACNSVHFFDLVSWWTGETLVSIENNGLEKDWFVSKRKGFYEINGSLTGKFSSGSSLKLVSENKEMDFSIHLRSSKDQWYFDYSNNGFFGPNNFNIPGKEMLQSELATCLVDEILDNESCELTFVKDNLGQFKILLSFFLDHWNNSNKSFSNKIPIT